MTQAYTPSQSIPAVETDWGSNTCTYLCVDRRIIREFHRDQVASGSDLRALYQELGGPFDLFVEKDHELPRGGDIESKSAHLTQKEVNTRFRVAAELNINIYDAQARTTSRQAQEAGYNALARILKGECDSDRELLMHESLAWVNEFPETIQCIDKKTGLPAVLKKDGKTGKKGDPRMKKNPLHPYNTDGTLKSSELNSCLRMYLLRVRNPGAFNAMSKPPRHDGHSRAELSARAPRHNASAQLLNDDPTRVSASFQAFQNNKAGLIDLQRTALAATIRLLRNRGIEIDKSLRDFLDQSLTGADKKESLLRSVYAATHNSDGYVRSREVKKNGDVVVVPIGVKHARNYLLKCHGHALGKTGHGTPRAYMMRYAFTALFPKWASLCKNIEVDMSSNTSNQLNLPMWDALKREFFDVFSCMQKGCIDACVRRELI